MTISPVVADHLNSCPPTARGHLLALRSLVYEVAKEEALGEIAESLKWGEPSYASKRGSPIRMNWKPASDPDTPSGSKSTSLGYVSLYFNCKTRLVETFREIYGNKLQFVGNRELVLAVSKPLPVDELRDCISMALRYHDIKHLPLLGA